MSRAKRLAVLLALAGVVAGGWTGWSTQAPMYRCEGRILVEPRLPNPQDPCGDGLLPMFEGFMAYQVQLLNAGRTTLLALETEVWKATGEGADAEVAARFTRRRTIVRSPGTLHILVRFEDVRPEVALAGVRALLEAYESLTAPQNESLELLESAKKQQEPLTARLENTRKEILTITATYGGAEGLALRHLAAVEQVLETERELARVRSAIESGEQADGTKPEDLQRRAEALANRLEELQKHSRKFGQTRKEVERLQADVADHERKLNQMQALCDQLENQLLDAGSITIQDPGTLPTEPSRDSRLPAAAVGVAVGALLGLLLAFLLRRRR